MTNEEIKKLAKASIEDGMINEKIARFSMQNMKRSELKSYLRYLRYEMSKNILTVTLPAAPSREIEQEIEKEFEGKPIRFIIDESLGGGIRIKNGDDIIDLSLKNYIIQTVRKIRENL